MLESLGDSVQTNQSLSGVDVAKVLESTGKLWGREERGGVVESRERVSKSVRHVGQRAKNTGPV